MNDWEGALGQLLTANEAAALVGSPEKLAEFDDQGELIALQLRAGKVVYPAFQFAAGRALPALADAHRTVAAAVSEWTAASWCVGEHPELRGRSPRAWAAAGHDLKRLRMVAEHDAARLMH